MKALQTLAARLSESTVSPFVDELIKTAIAEKASDIHLEPFSDSLRIRLRIDGLLIVLLNLPGRFANAVCSRLKIMGQLDIAEKRLPQDGRFSYQAADHNIDCRLSSCPTLFGEKLVLRLLNTHEKILMLEELGLEPAQLHLLKAALNEPQGLILVTGPTGSGKTVTLYAALHYLNTLTRNILTVEDPVEIQLEGINQVNIHPKAGLSFAKTLRAFLRQDPDIIMVGEIRDLETAEIAIKAAQTGHLVLSTLHTNSALESLTRLINMGIPPYLTTSALTLVMAQRLIRKICAQCRGEGCEHCRQGFQGRTALYECIALDPVLEEHLLKGAPLATLKSWQQNQGYLTLQQAGDLKVAAGITNATEIARVTRS